MQIVGFLMMRLIFCYYESKLLNIEVLRFLQLQYLYFVHEAGMTFYCNFLTTCHSTTDRYQARLRRGRMWSVYGDGLQVRPWTEENPVSFYVLLQF